MVKKLRIAAILLVLLLGAIYGYLQLRKYQSFKQSVHKDAALILKINLDALLLSELKHPGGPLNGYTSNRMLPEGISMPSNLILYTLKNKPSGSFFCVLKVSDSAALKKYLKSTWQIHQFSMQEGGDVYGNSLDGKLSVAYNSAELAFSYSFKKTPTKDILTDLLGKRKLLDPEDPRLQFLRKASAEFAYISGNYKGTGNFNDHLLQVRGTVPVQDLGLPAQFFSNIDTKQEGALKFWLNADLQKILSKAEFNLKGHLPDKTMLMKYYSGYTGIEIRNSLFQTDSVITYEYNDDFEKTARVELKQVQVPELQIQIGSPDANAFFTDLQDQKFVTEKGLWNRNLFPLYRVYANKEPGFLNLSTSLAKIRSAAMKPSPYFVYLDIDFDQIKRQKMFPFLNPYIKNLRHLQVQGTQKANGPGRIEMDLLFNKEN